MSKKQQTKGGVVALVGVNIPDGDGEARIEAGERIPAKLATEPVVASLLALDAIADVAPDTLTTTNDEVE